jgi:tetratricopeptide (TPR) repeat protein
LLTLPTLAIDQARFVQPIQPHPNILTDTHYCHLEFPKTRVSRFPSLPNPFYNPSMKATFLGLLCLTAILGAQATRGPLWETSWSNPEFVKRFTGSYGFDSSREPTIDRQEQQLFQEIAPLLEQNNVAAATRRLQESLTPDSSAALNYTLGNLYYQSGQLEAAAQAYRDALRKFPSFARASKNLGLVLMQLGNNAGARPYLIKTIELGSADSSTYGLLGYCAYLDGQYSSALSAYEQALLLDPASLEWQIGRAQCLYSMERYREAASAYDEILLAHPNRDDVWLMQANTWLALDKPESAAANIEVVRRLGKATPDALMLLGDIHLSQDLPRLATRAYAEAISSQRLPTAAASLRAATLLADRASWDDTETLISLIEQRYQVGLEHEQANQLLTLKARLALARGDAQQAARTLRNLLERAPMNGPALLLLADHEASQGQIEEATILYERAARLPEFQADAHVRHARMLVSRQNYAEAIKLLRQAQNLRPRENVARYLEAVERAHRSTL